MDKVGAGYLSERCEQAAAILDLRELLVLDSVTFKMANELTAGSEKMQNLVAHVKLTRIPKQI